MDYNITFRRKNKGWQFIISYKFNGKWKQKSKQGFKSQKEAKPVAEAMLEDLKQEIENQKHLNIEYMGITLKKFSQIYLEHESLYREKNTIEMKEYSLKKFKILNDMLLKDISNLDIQKCVDVMIKDGLSKQTIKNYLSMLKAMFNSAINQFNIITSNPVSNIKLPEDKGLKEKKALTQAQFQHLLDNIKDCKLNLITLLAGSCGLRIGEILGLKWSDIDEINLTISIKRQLKRVGDKNKHGIGSLKTKNSYRTIPLSENVYKKLKNYKNTYPLNFDDRLFNFTNTSSMASRLSELYLESGYDISIHELRHTYATTLIANGVDFKTVAKLMGHSVEQTIRTYSHVTDEMMKKATQTIRSIF
ncbi:MULTISPECIES: tyrosine-type recombinase/integrase [Clostridium]|uniref:tyrosine-type recombinase/integrase n=1 Tax=Clostridium TaxID=1485 RepID=UPI0007745898|nr:MULTISPECIES: tyrosine-type recombinase/integrase [Clostridium]AUM96361.1 site-specific integrase [Clostridium sporogenes]AVQ53812.1 site-specific integrase [Clostridium botulinum]